MTLLDLGLGLLAYVLVVALGEIRRQRNMTGVWENIAHQWKQRASEWREMHE